MQTSLERLGQFVTNHRFDADRKRRLVIRNLLIDCYGCMLIGAQQPIVKKSMSALTASGLINPNASTPVYGSDIKASVAGSAMLNSIAGHALDFDDWEVPGNTHVSNMLVPAILAASHARGLSGGQMIDAYIVGYEVIARIGMAINLEHYDRGWHATATLGAIGVAASVARVLNLDAEQSTHAMAIAVSRAQGFTAQFGSESKPLQVGMACEGGLQAACFAAAGLSGQPHMLDHAKGLIALMGHDQAQRLPTALQSLGHELTIDVHGIVVKPWPCCGYTHRILTAILELRASGVEAQAIEQIECHLPDMHAGILPFKHPLNRSEALFSLPYCAAMVILNGELTIADLEVASWQQAEVKTLIDKISIHPFKPIRPELNYDPEQPDRIIVRGHKLATTIEVAYPLGAPQNPMDEAQLIDKFTRNAVAAGFDGSRLVSELREWPESDNIHPLLSA